MYIYVHCRNKQNHKNPLPLEKHTHTQQRVCLEHGSHNVSRWMTWLPISLKNAAKCDKWYQLQNHFITESLNAEGAREKLLRSQPRACRNLSVESKKSKNLTKPFARFNPQHSVWEQEPLVGVKLLSLVRYDLIHQSDVLFLRPLLRDLARTNTVRNQKKLNECFFLIRNKNKIKRRRGPTKEQVSFPFSLFFFLQT